MFKNRGLVIGLSIIILGYFVYLIQGILLPFIVALVFAYLLDPIVQKVERFRISRTVSTLIVVIMFFIVMALISTMIIPMIYTHIPTLVEFLLQYKESLSSGLVPDIVHKVKGLSPEFMKRAEQSLHDLSGHIVAFIISVLKEVFHSGFVAINLLSLIFISPIITFYVLRDWDKIPSTIANLIPKGWISSYHQLIHDLDYTLSGYLRGQISVCLILGGYYALMLSMIGLKSGATLGILAGVLTFVPYIGVIFSAILATIIAALQFQTLSYIMVVIIIFLTGHLVESNVITPKLIGDKVGLHPVWIIFGLLTCGVLFGFIGILISLPLTAMLGVVIKFLISRYKASAFYNNI